MKKAYVKVKTPSAKTVLKRPYIAATIIGAAVCAIVLSVTIKPLSDVNKTEENVVFSTENDAASQTKETPIELPYESGKNEAEVPEREEVFAVEPEEDVKEETAESVSVGLLAKEQISLKKPVDDKIVKDFSYGKPVKSKTMDDWRVHNGIDILAKSGTLVLACADGEVVQAQNNSLTGFTISIEHPDGVISTVYNLLDIDSVTIGQKVKQGDVIGKAGSSAKIEMLDEAHVHFEVTKDGKFVDPKEYFK